MNPQNLFALEIYMQIFCSLKFSLELSHTPRFLINSIRDKKTYVYFILIFNDFFKETIESVITKTPKIIFSRFLENEKTRRLLKVKRGKTTSHISPHMLCVVLQFFSTNQWGYIKKLDFPINLIITK